jgi:hypothetical protein
MKSYKSKFYIYLLLGYAVYLPIFFNLCGGDWFFLFVCLMFHNVWANYLSNFFVKKSEQDLKDAEAEVRQTLETEISDEYREQLEDVLDEIIQIKKTKK